MIVNEDLKIRTKNFAVRIIKLFAALPKTTEAQVLGKQILRCGTLVGAQEHNTVNPSMQNLMLILSVKSKALCRNWRKPYIGWN